jgi:hypothetical protein
MRGCWSVDLEPRGIENYGKVDIKRPFWSVRVSILAPSLDAMKGGARLGHLVGHGVGVNYLDARC